MTLIARFVATAALLGSGDCLAAASDSPAKATTAATADETARDPKLQAELEAILENDQKHREHLEAVEKQYGADSAQVRDLWAVIQRADAENLAKVTQILDTRGWVGPEVVGSLANEALFLVIQHADLAAQQKYLPMMRAAVKEKKASAASLALLEDRIALREGRPQTYGSQIGTEADGKYYVQALADPDHVDGRRASVGLSPIAEYVKHWDIVWNVEEYKQKLPMLMAELKSAP